MTKEARTGRKGLRDEAADWFASMRAPDAASRRAEFETWLGADPRHRDAYNRIGEAFSLGKGLKRQSDRMVAASFHELNASAWRRPLARIGVGGAMAAVLILGVLASTTVLLRMLTPGDAASSAPKLAEGQELVARRGEIRTFELADGSRVTLDTDSQVLVSYSARRRALELIRGRARFKVAHETRPFVVAAAGSAVIARGTVFDITVSTHRTAFVHLIEGTVDVRDIASPPRGEGEGKGEQGGGQGMIRLKAGHSLSLGTAGVRPAPRLLADGDWPNGLRDFRNAELGALIAEANRYASKPIVLASDDLAALQVSGTFSVRDTRRLADNLAGLLGLALRDENGKIVLSTT